MRNRPILLLSIALIAFAGTIDAQKRAPRAVKEKRIKKTVRKTTRGAVGPHKVVRKRVNRTRVVHYHYRHLPKRGAVVKNIHAKAVAINHKGIGFRYHSGVWYQPVRSEWKVVRPARGIRIRTLPAGYRKIKVGLNVYFYHYGTYYIEKDKEYEVVDTPIGAEIDSLPEGYETISVAGEEYYKLDGTYYMPSTNESGEEILVAVPDPTS